MAKKTSKEVKAKINDLFFHKNEKKMFIVTDVMQQPKGKLYTFEEIGPKDEVSYKRCYEEQLPEKYSKSKSTKAAKILYGKKK